MRNKTAIYIEMFGLLIRALVLKAKGSDDITQTRCFQEILLCYKCWVLFLGLIVSANHKPPKT